MNIFRKIKEELKNDPLSNITEKKKRTIITFTFKEHRYSIIKR